MINQESITKNISDENKFQELESAKALNDIALELLRHKKSDHTKMFVIIILLIVMNIVQCALFIWYINQESEVVETITTEETITQDTEGDGNNVYQSGEEAQYIQQGKTEVNSDGETDDSSQDNDNSFQSENSDSEVE